MNQSPTARICPAVSLNAKSAAEFSSPNAIFLKNLAPADWNAVALTSCVGIEWAGRPKYAWRHGTRANHDPLAHVKILVAGGL